MTLKTLTSFAAALADERTRDERLSTRKKLSLVFEFKFSSCLLHQKAETFCRAIKELYKIIYSLFLKLFICS